MNTEKSLKQIENYIYFGVIALLPILVLSFFANVFETPKLALAVIAVLLIVLLKVVRALMTNKISFSTSLFDIPVFIFATIYLVSGLLESPNIMDAFFLPGSASIVITGALLYFITNQLGSKQKKIAKEVLFFSSVAYSLIVLLTVAGVFQAIPQLPAFVRTSNFNTLGSSLPGMIFLIVTAPIGIKAIVNNKEVTKRALYGVSMALLGFALLVNVFNNLPGRPTAPQLPSLATSWSVAVDAVKINPLLGMGPGNYLSAFTRFVPLEYNQSPIWSVRYTSGRSYAFTMFTETGIAGFGAFAMLLLAVYRAIKKRKVNDPVAISLGLSTAMLIAFPSTSVLLFTFFILLGLSSESEDSTFDVFNFEGRENKSRLPVLVATLPMIALVIAIGYYAQRVIAADTTYKRALGLIAQNNGSGAYDTLRSAINTNPLVDRYRVSYAQINLAIANSLASNENISDQDRQTIAQLIQQAIREGKNAVSLNPTKANNWEVLGSIYQAVAPLADGGYSFAAQTYRQAIALDPINPNLRISLGGIFYAVGQYNDAIDTFELAASVKPDHANSFFNLAAAYREAGRIDDAINAMSVVLSLVDRDSTDFEVATKALNDLQDKKANAEIEGSDNLTAPEQANPDAEPVIELDENQAPPEAPVLDEQADAEATAEPTATATPTPSPSVEPSPTATPLP